MAALTQFPYGEMVAAAIEDLQRQGFLFPGCWTDNERSYNGWSKLKKSIDPGIAEWTLHDPRRTFATNLAALEVPPHVVERLLDHASGMISGVAAIYNRFSVTSKIMRESERKWGEPDPET